MGEHVCYIVGAGAFFGRGLEPRRGDLVIAADGGYRPLIELGVAVDIVVGDFDSLPEVPDHPNTVRLKKEKDDTDMRAALQLGLDNGYTEFRIYGGTGGRVDHTLANIQCIAWLSQLGARGYLVGDGWTITAVTDGEMTFPAEHSGFVSVFSHGDTAEGVTLRGLKYPLHNAALSNQVPLGVSNEFTGVESSVSVRRGTLVIVFYR